MTPKEKAQDLIDKFISEGCLFANARKCALIAVDEIVVVGVMNFNDMQYWQQVKTEIEKL